MAAIRWLLVLPSGVLAFLAGAVFVEFLAKEILPFLDRLTGLNPVYGFLFSVKYSWIPFMWLSNGLGLFAATKMAPKKKFVVSVVLASLISLLLLFMTGYYAAMPPWERPNAFSTKVERTVPLMIFASLSTVGLMALLCFVIWNEEREAKEKVIRTAE